MADKRNTVIAIVLSLAVLLGWQYFIAKPQLESQQAAQQAQQAQQANSQAGAASGSAGTAAAPANSAGPTPGTSAPDSAGQVTAMSREDALKATPRVAIDTPHVSGSINLVGGKIDDLRLKDYHETVDPKSPTIELFSPTGTEHAYYADYGWVADPGSKLKLPNSQTKWTVEGNDKLTHEHPVTLTYDNGEGLIFKRTIAIDDHYMFTVNQSVENHTSESVHLYPYGLVSKHGKPETRSFYILHEGAIGVLGDQGVDEIKYSKLEDDKQVVSDSVSSGWLGLTDKYWAATLIPQQGETFKPRFSYNPKSDNFQADYLGKGQDIAPNSQAEIDSHLFAGAKRKALLDQYQENLHIPRFNLLIDWGWFYFLTKPMFWVIDHLYHLVGNFGIAILLVTVIVKLIFFPLANKSYVSMSKMKLVQPQMAEIKERYGDDKARQQQALMELYKKEKINPLAGCLPIAIQIPVFFSLYKVLFVTIEMRHAPFFGWIQDLSAPDPTTIFNLFGLIPWTPPHSLMLGVWPIIMGFTMFVQMKMNPTPPDKTQQMIFTWMPLIFMFMLASFPAGLVIYWAWNNTLSVTQQYVIMRRQGVKVELWDNLGHTFRLKRKKKVSTEK